MWSSAPLSQAHPLVLPNAVSTAILQNDPNKNKDGDTKELTGGNNQRKIPWRRAWHPLQTEEQWATVLGIAKKRTH